MSSRVICDNGHLGGYCRDAAIQLARRGALEPCHRSNCNVPRRYIVRQTYANSGETHEYELEKVVRLYSDNEADSEGYDPMLFLLRHRKKGHKVLWLFYWGKDRSGRWRVGQFPPLLSVKSLKYLMQSIRI